MPSEARLRKLVHETRNLGYNQFISHPTAPTGQELMPMAVRLPDSGSTNPHTNLRSALKFAGPDQRLDAERAFSSVLVNTVREAIGNALGRNVLEILTSKGLLDDASNSTEFDRKLRSLFGNGAAVLERIIVKDLNWKLGIPYNSETRLDYQKSLETAKEICFVESRLK
jgi:hypothetical protein